LSRDFVEHYLLTPTRSFLRKHGPMLIVLVVACLIRVLLAITYLPWVCGDSLTYIPLVKAIRSYNWLLYNGFRSPGYSVLLHLSIINGSIQVTIWTQLVMGIVTAMLVYATVLMADGRKSWAMAAGLVQALALPEAQLEVTLLPESFTSFLLAIWMWVACGILVKRFGQGLCTWCMAGLLLASAALTRPNNAMLIPLAALILPLLRDDGARRGLKLARGMAILVTGCLPVLIWSWLLWGRFGMFSLSTQSGFHLTHKTLDYIELAPERYAPIRQVLMKWRADHVPPNVPMDSRIWFAYPELNDLPIFKHDKKDVAQRFAEISSELLAMNRAIILAHPIKYLAAVHQSWWRFWDTRGFSVIGPEVMSDPVSERGTNVVKAPFVQDILGRCWALESLFLRSRPWLFLAMAAGLTVDLFWRRFWRGVVAGRNTRARTPSSWQL